VFADNKAKQKKYNSKKYRPKGASKFDNSYVGTGSLSRNSRQNRGFNPETITKNFRTKNGGTAKGTFPLWDENSKIVTPQDRKRAAKQGFIAMINNDWRAMVNQAKSAAEDCKCDCDKITVKFNIREKELFKNNIKGTGFKIPKNKVFPCKKNKKSN
jgi:hypothetical protein